MPLKQTPWCSRDTSFSLERQAQTRSKARSDDTVRPRRHSTDAKRSVPVVGLGQGNVGADGFDSFGSDVGRAVPTIDPAADDDQRI